MPMSSDQLALARQYLADPGTSAVQQLQISNATGGTFTITFNGQTTAAIAYPAQAGDVQNAMSALSNVGLGGVNVIENAGVPNSVFFVLYFAGSLANAAQPVITANTSGLTGVGVTQLITQTVAGGITAFSDAELGALYDNAKANFFLAICYGFRALQSNAAKFVSYVAGQSKEDKQQIYDHLEALAMMYEQWANADRQVQFTKLKSVPPRPTAVPVTSGVPATGLQYAPPFNNRPWSPFVRGGPR